MAYNFQLVQLNTASPEKSENSVLIIYTGGTLGMVENEDGALIPLDFAHIIDHIPALRSLKLHLTVASFPEPIDSSDITPEHWVIIAEVIGRHYDEFDGFVILHGTDTMAYTASALSFMLQNLQKPVILTGAQLPISATRSDGRENFITSMELAVARENGRPVVPEVAIYFDYMLLRGNRSRKVESMFFDAFESENYPALAEAGISISYKKHRILYNRKGPLTIFTKIEQGVAILRLFPGMTTELMEAVIETKGLKGLILETYGSGNAPTSEWFFQGLKKALDKDIIIFNVSQCMGGRVIQGKYQTSQRMKDMGVLSGKDITTEAALTKMMLLLGTYNNREKIKTLLTSSICGEMSDMEEI